MATTTDAAEDWLVVQGLRGIVVLVGAALIALTADSAPAAPHSSRAARHMADAGTLALRGAISLRSIAAACPAGTPASADECFARTGSGVIPGLGTVSESYTFIVDTDGPGCEGGSVLLASDGRLAVAGKGEIDLAISGLPNCFVPAATVLTASRPFTVTGGSSAYAGASGSGTLQHDARLIALGAVGTDTWVGTLVVPGLEFDLTVPVLSGAVTRTVRAPQGKKLVRVIYRVAARDEVDGVVPVICVPRSGTLFRIGRKTVICSATDKSANTAQARFTVTVRARR
jgi:hypothetical protein